MLMWGAFLGFIAVTLWVGYKATHQVGSAEDFMVAGRSLGPVSIICTQIATWVGAGSLVGFIGTGYKYGVSTIAYCFAAGIAALTIAYMWAGWLRKKGFITMPDWMCYIYNNDKYVRVFTSLWYIFMYCSWVIGQATGCGIMTANLLGIPAVTGALICGFVFIIFTVTGGFYAVAWMDVWQQIVMTIGVVILFVGVAMKTGFTGLTQLPSEYFNFSLPNHWWVISIVLSYFCGNLFGQTYYQRVYASKDLKTAKQGLIAGFIALIVVGLYCTTIGLTARAMGAELVKADNAIFWIIENLFPKGIGVIYLIAILAAAMSTADSALNAASTNFANDIYSKVINPSASDKKVLKVARYATVGLGILCMLMSLKPLQMLIFVFKGAYVATMGGIFWPLLLGMYWKRATLEAAKITLVVGGITGIAFEFLPSLNTIVGGGAIPGLIIGFLLMIGISFITKTKCGGAAYRDGDYAKQTNT